MKDFPKDDGTYATLGLVGAAALTGYLLQQDHGSSNKHHHHGSGSCSMCGNRTGSANVPKKTSVEDRARNLVNNLGSSLYQQRFDARANFLVPVSLRNRINKGRENFIQQKQKEAYMAMGAKQVALKKKKISVDYVVPRSKRQNSLKYTPQMRQLALAQKARLEAMGVGPLAPGARTENPTQTPQLEPLMDADVYAQAKVKDNIKTARKKLAEGKKEYPRWKVDNLMAFYVAYLYSERAWTAHVLTETGFTRRKDRKPASNSKGDPGILKGVKIQLGLPAQIPELNPGKAYDVKPHRNWRGKAHKDKQPRLFYFKGNTEVALYNVGGSGTMGSFATGKVGGSLLTQTSKMSAPSFSLPAGEPKAGGTCVFAGMAAQQKFGDDYFICRRCYATSANYGYAEAMLSAESRFQWVVDLLTRGGSELFAMAMIAAISSYARDGKLDARETQEIGIWNGRELTYRRYAQEVYRGVRRNIRAPLQSTDLQQTGAQVGLPSNIKTTTDWFRSQGVPNGAVAGFFRIHDSGDFTVGNARMQKQYIDAWGRVAYVLRFVQFWSPTRIWARRQSLSRLSGADKRWVQAGFKEGRRLAVSGSAAIRQRIARKARSVAQMAGISIFDAPQDPEMVLEQGGEDMLVGEQEAPGERDAELTGAGGSLFTYVPNEPICKQLVAVTAQVSNFAIRPSALYVKTPSNPAYIPYVTVPVARYNGKPYGKGSNALTAGSGVNVKFGGSHGYGSAQKAKANGIEDPSTYVELYDNRGESAYQCPVYSKLIPKKGGKKDKKTGLPEMTEAKTCQLAGCRACWIALDKPITYGFH